METGKQQSEHVGYSIENFNNCENIPEGAKVAFFTYGRFQPGHRGHDKMIMTLLDVAMKHNERTKMIKSIASEFEQDFGIYSESTGNK